MDIALPDAATGTKPHLSTEICVIIVNYGTANLSIEAVESVLAQNHDGRTVDVHLLDNASPGDDAEVFARAHAERGWADRVTLYPETVNHGFGRGNNVALRALAAREVPPKYVMLLNPDAVLDGETIAIMARVMDADPTIGLAGAGISNPDGALATAAFRFPNKGGEFAQALNFGPVSRLFPTVPLPPDHPEGEVDWVAGAAVLARLNALQAVDFFDPAFFLYYEEVDLMHRIKKQGWKIRYIPQARVIHAEGASTGVKSATARRRRPAYWYQSWHHYFVKHHGRAGAAVAGAGWMVGAAGDHVISRLRGREPRAALHLFSDFWAVAGRPLLGLEPRPYV